MRVIGRWFRRSSSHRYESWPIFRTGPVGKRYGRAFSVFINNWQCHLTTIEVFSDGLIDAWGALDRDLFEKKLRSRWVVSRPQSGQNISVHNFGATGATDDKWYGDIPDVRTAVGKALKELNPTSTELIDMEGHDSVLVGKVRHAKYPLPDKHPYRIIGDAEIPGDSVPVLIAQNGRYLLTRLFIFADGITHTGAATETIALQDALARYDSGEYANTAPRGSRVEIAGLGEFTTTSDFGRVAPQERKKEIQDLHRSLNGSADAVRICREAFHLYTESPSEKTKEALRQAYEAVPAHHRLYCGDMDTKDAAIRQVLFGYEADE